MISSKSQGECLKNFLLEGRSSLTKGRENFKIATKKIKSAQKSLCMKSVEAKLRKSIIMQLVERLKSTLKARIFMDVNSNCKTL